MKLRRIDSTRAEVLGHFVDDEEKFLCCTLERPWLDNAHGVSCIPAGTYTCKRRHSPHFNCDVFEITGVPGRDLIEIHPANYVTQLNGCVGVGKSFADINHDGVTDVASSQDAFKEFMKLHEGINEFTLEVIDPQLAVAA